MEIFVTLKQIFSDYGILGILIFALATYGVWKIYRDSKTITDKVESISSDVALLRTAISHEKGDPVLHYSMLKEISDELTELRQDSEKHYSAAQKCHDDIARQADSNKYQTCDVNKCIHLTKVNNDLSRILDRFDDFDKRADESRSSTLNTLDSINLKIIELGRESGDMARSIIDVLRDFLTNKKSNK